MKIIISTGQGRLHLIESAKSLLESKKVELNIITGWIPSPNIPLKWIDYLGALIGRKKLSSGFQKRTPNEIPLKLFKSCSISEFAIQLLFIISKYRLISRDNAAVIGWNLYSNASKKYLKKGYDIFHVRSGAGQAGAITKAKSLGMKVIVDHSIAHPQEVYNQLLKANNGSNEGIFIKPDSNFWKMVIKDCYDADLLLVNSQYVKDSFIKNGFKAENISIAHLGVRKDFLGLKKEYSINKTLKLVFTGGFGLRKGGFIIIKALERLIKYNIDFEFHVFGSIINDFTIPETFIKNDKIFFHGFIPQDNLKEHLSTSDIYIFPSYSEGAAQSLKEAMAIGLPVITTKESGGPIVDKENSIKIESNSVEELVDAIILLINSQSLREYIGKNAVRTIEKKHTWEKYSKEVILNYEKLCQVSS